MAALGRGEEVPRAVLVVMEAGSAELRMADEDEGWMLRENDAAHLLSAELSIESIVDGDDFIGVSAWALSRDAGLAELRLSFLSEDERNAWTLVATLKP